MKKLLALLMIWLLLPIAGAEEAYTMQDGSLILLDGAGRKCQPIAMKSDFPEALLADADISGAIQLNLPETLVQAGVDPRSVWRNADEIVKAVLADPCCQSNPMAVEDFLVRRILEEVTGRV